MGRQGYQRDSETDLYYLRARYYDPDTGQFILPDPIGFEGGDPNLYRYCANDPVNKVDPSGHEEFFIGDDPPPNVIAVLNAKGIHYEVIDLGSLLGPGVYPPAGGLSGPLKVIIIDAKGPKGIDDGIEGARSALSTQSPGLFSFGEHQITWDKGKNKARFAILKEGEKAPSGVKYYANPAKEGDYYPAINYLLSRNYYAGYPLQDLLDAQQGIPIRKRCSNPVGPGPCTDPISWLVPMGKVVEAYRRYLTASKKFPLFPGGNLLKGFLELVLPYVPLLGDTAGKFLKDLLAKIPPELFDYVATLISPAEAIGPLLVKFLRPVLVELVNKLTDNESIRKIILQAFDTLIAGQRLDGPAATDLILSLLKLIEGGAGLADLIVLLSGGREFDCERIIKILLQLAKVANFDPLDVRRLRECCEAAKQGQNLKPDELIERILAAAGIRAEDAAQLKKWLEQLKVIAQELKSSNPNLQRITEAIKEILTGLLGENDPRVQELLQILKQIGNALAVVLKLRAAAEDFKNGNNEGAVENVAQALEMAGQKEQADLVRRRKEWLVALLGLLGAGIGWLGIGGLGLNDPQAGAQEGGPQGPPKCDITRVILIPIDAQAVPAGLNFSDVDADLGAVSSDYSSRDTGKKWNDPKTSGEYRYVLLVVFTGPRIRVACDFARYARGTLIGVDETWVKKLRPAWNPTFQQVQWNRTPGLPNPIMIPAWQATFGTADYARGDKASGKDVPDGPAGIVYHRTDDSIVAIWDAPGIKNLTNALLPVQLSVHFYVKAFPKGDPSAESGAIWYDLFISVSNKIGPNTGSIDAIVTGRKP